mmetsp:Transcript_23232/g.53461  ORF Transcript_23232/g.53461 Transcript_23232/m.53461 type:complete len:329 (+) Transcript_23232:36-1022(+)
MSPNIGGHMALHASEEVPMNDWLTSLHQAQERLRTEAQARHDDIRSQVEAQLQKLLADAQVRIEVDMSRVFTEVEFAVQAAGSKAQMFQSKLLQQESENAELRQKIEQVKCLAGGDRDEEAKASPPQATTDQNLAEQLASMADAAAFARHMQRADTLSRAEMRKAGKQLELQAQAIQQLRGELLSARSGVEAHCAEVQELRRKLSDIARHELGTAKPEPKANSPIVPRLNLRGASRSTERKREDADHGRNCSPGSPVRIIDCSAPAPATDGPTIRQAHVLRARLLADGGNPVACTAAPYRANSSTRPAVHLPARQSVGLPGSPQVNRR